MDRVRDPSENSIKSPALFWLGVIFMIFGGIINVALIVMEIYPDLSIGLIVSLYTILFGLLTTFTALRTRTYEIADAITWYDKGLMLAIILLAVIHPIFGVLLPVVFSWWAFFFDLIFVFALVAAYLIIEQRAIKATLAHAAQIFIIMLIGFFLYFVLWYPPFGAMFFTDGDFIIAIIFVILGGVYTVAQLFQPITTKSAIEWEFPDGVTDGMGKKLFVVLMTTISFIASGVLMTTGFILVGIEATPEFLALGWVLIGIGFGLLALSIGLVVYSIFKLVTKNNDNQRPRLALLILMIIVGVAIGFVVGYLLFIVFPII